jgi:ferredoxin
MRFCDVWSCTRCHIVSEAILEKPDLPLLTVSDNAYAQETLRLSHVCYVVSSSQLYIE